MTIMTMEQQQAHCHERRRHHRRHVHYQALHAIRRRHRTRVERLVTAAVILELSAQSAVSHGFHLLQPCSSSFCTTTSSSSSSSGSMWRSHLLLSTPARHASSTLRVSASSEKQKEDGKDQTAETATTTTKRDAAFPISSSYQRQMRAMMEATTIIIDDKSRSSAISITTSTDSAASSSSSNDAAVAVSQEEYQRGLLTIGFCTLVFASMSPAMHACLVSSSSADPAALGAPPVLLLNAAVSAVAFAGLIMAGPFLERVIPKPSTLLVQKQAELSSSSSKKATIMEFSSQTMMSSTTTSSSFSSLETLDSEGYNKGAINNPFTTSVTNRAGLELGLWKFLGTTANLFGLSMTSADHGAFLIQLTTLIVPTVQGIMGVPIPKRIQGSIALALLGVALFTQDFSTVTSAASASATGGDVDTAAALLLSTTRQQQLTGDALCVLAAVFYATYDLRLYEWGKRVAPRELITTKIGAQALFSLALLLSAPGAWSESVSFFQTAMDSASFLDNAPTLLMLVPLVLWSGFMVNAIVPFLQVGGQQAIGPTRAQTLYASQPLWAAIMSFFFLGETVGMQGLVGGGAFMVALFLAATTAQAPESNSSSSSPTINTETTTATTTSVTTESAIVEPTMRLARQEQS